MTKVDVAQFVTPLLMEQLSCESVRFNALLREEMGATSLDMASLQIALEDKFGLVFADGATPPTDIDRAWEQVRTPQDLIELVLKYARLS